MNDTIIDNFYKIRDYLDQVKDYVNEIKEQKNIFDSSFTKPREHLYDIYSDRLDFSIYSGEYYEGLAEVLKRMKYSDLKNVRLSCIDGEKKSCFIFSSENFDIILGLIFYNN